MILGQKYPHPPFYRLQCWLKSAHVWRGYFSARSGLNEGVPSATAIMMWPRGRDGQKQATNFGQSSGQKADETHPEQEDAGYVMCLARGHYLHKKLKDVRLHLS